MTTIADLPFSARGRFRELILLFLPLLGVTFCNYLFLLVEKLFLARLSSASMEAAVNICYACQIFQGTTICLVMMAQVCVGRWYGARSFTSIGPGIWQFIWFSFLSMLLTVPVSLLYGAWYFRGTAIEAIGLPYFYLLVGFNFLYPLSAVLSCFYLGQGKTRLVLVANLAAQLMKIGLAYLLIFGVEGLFPSQGILGGAISTICAQGLFCVLLGGIFLNRNSRALFHSHDWRFRPALFWECIYPGFLRAINRILSFTSWAAIAHLMLSKGNDYLLVLSTGGAVGLFLPFLFDSVCQAQTTVVSFLFGAKKLSYLRQATYSGFILVALLAILLAIPLLAYPLPTFQWLFPDVVLRIEIIQKIFIGLWCSFTFFTLLAIPLSIVLAAKDMGFSCAMGIVNWLNGYLLMYLALEHFAIAADEFWLVLSLMHGSTFLLYCFRMRHLIRVSMNLTPAAA